MISSCGKSIRPMQVSSQSDTADLLSAGGLCGVSSAVSSWLLALWRASPRSRRLLSSSGRMRMGSYLQGRNSDHVQTASYTGSQTSEGHLIAAAATGLGVPMIMLTPDSYEDADKRWPDTTYYSAPDETYEAQHREVVCMTLAMRHGALPTLHQVEAGLEVIDFVPPTYPTAKHDVDHHLCSCLARKSFCAKHKQWNTSVFGQANNGSVPWSRCPWASNRTCRLRHSSRPLRE